MTPVMGKRGKKVEATTGINTASGTGLESRRPSNMIHTIMNPRFMVMRRVPTVDAPIFIPKNARDWFKKEHTIRNGLMNYATGYESFLKAARIDYEFAIIIQSGFSDGGRPSNARCKDLSEINGTVVCNVFVNVENAPLAPDGMGKWDPRWILARVCHEIAEFQVARTLKALEIAMDKEEAQKVIRHVIKDYYPNEVSAKYITN